MKTVFQLLRILFFPALKGSISYIKTYASGIPFRYLMQDVLSVLQKVGFLVLLAIIASVIFLFLPQGIDTMLVVIEDLNDGKAAKFIFLLITLVIWSIVSEFGIRYAIYVSDNSGKSLSDKRVAWRKAVQRIIAASCLLWPTLLIFISLIITLCWHTGTHYLHWVLAFFCLYVLFCVLTNLYFYKAPGNRPGTFGNNFILAPQRLPLNEQKWLNKLYGIYNDYVFSVPNAAGFNLPGSTWLSNFNSVFNTTQQTRNRFPQSTALSDDARIPLEFELLKVTPEVPDGMQDFKWNYRIPVNFYIVLHKQIKYIACIAFIIFLIVCFIPVNLGVFEFVGAPALVCLAFACWIGIYIGLLYLDFAKLRRLPISVRFLLFIFLLVSSVINKDHPLRETDNVKNLSGNRPRLDMHFAEWFRQYQADMDSAYAVKDTSKTKGKKDAKLKKYPVVFICAEGGALRTGGFTALYLTRLQRALQDSLGYDFKRSVYAMSGVSGGALGLGLFNAVSYVNNSKELISGRDSEQSAQLFFEGDFIAPVIGKMFFGDLLNLIWPIHVNVFDRAIAMEKAWENQYAKLLVVKGDKANNVFSEPFDTLHFSARKKPLIIFNTDEVETGEQCWLTNVQPIGTYHDKERDLLNFKIKSGVNYSTGINFSTRFPLFSPGAMIKTKCDTIKLHYLDGGYVENTGAGSMLEVLEVIRKDTAIFKKIAPMVIFLRFSEQLPTANAKDNLDFGNEITEIFGGIYNARKGRSDVAVHQLGDMIKRYHGGVLDVPLSASKRAVPMNWILSKQSIENIKKDISEKIKNCENTWAGLQLDSIRYMPYKAIE